MLKKIIFSVTAFVAHLSSVGQLYGGIVFTGDGGRYSHSDDFKYIMIESGISSLDFSKQYPYVESFAINVSNYSPYYYWHAENDYGLSNNVNVKRLAIGGAPSQKLLNFAHMPNVKSYGVGTIYNNLDYLPFALPYISELELFIYTNYDPEQRASLGNALGNISKLSELEHFTLRMKGSYNSGFSDKEFVEISKMQGLKTLTIILEDLDWGQVGIDKINLQQALPTTNVMVETHYYFYQPSDY